MNRELSEKLDALAAKMEEVAGDWDKTMALADELRALANENYSPTAQWGEIRKTLQPKPASKKVYTDRRGRVSPF